MKSSLEAAGIAGVLRRLLLCFALSAMAGSAVAAEAGGAPLVKTADGVVRGITRNGVNIYLGIPYAAPPTGALRWRPPAPVKAWRGVREATRYASNCPQSAGLGVFAGPASVDEDCLYLNVFTTGGAGRKPVLVWIHGGGNVSGESNDYDGSKLATGGPHGSETVVVTLNYRLGFFGWFSHPALNAEGHPWGGYALLDQQAVLRWVQRNIAAFGGDPTRVTIGGESSGAVNVAGQLMSPMSRGLYRAAIMESAPSLLTISTPAADGLARGNSLAKAAGCPGAGAEAARCLRGLSAARILQLQATLKQNLLIDYPFPFVDGTIIPEPMAAALTAGHFNKVPFLGGVNDTESTFTTAGMEQYWTLQPVTADQYAGLLKAKSAAIQSAYALSGFGDDVAVANARLNSDPTFCRDDSVLMELSYKTIVYAYHFKYDKAPFYFPMLAGFKPLAAHTIEIQFLFPGFHGGPLGVNLDQATGQPRNLDAAETRLSDEMVAAWTNFARTGNPNGSGDAPWPRFAGGEARYLLADVPASSAPTSADLRAAHHCDLWEPPAH